MVYCVSDIHGYYDGYVSLLEKINLRDEDILYVIGDVVDRGDGSLRILQDMMLHHNIIPILGNHEYMAIQCLRFLSQEITEDSISCIDQGMVQGLMEWQNVGGQATMDEFHRLTRDEQEDIIEYLKEFSLYEEVRVNGREYVLVHAGLENFTADRPLDTYQLHEMIFNKTDYDKVYYSDKYLVTGHNPTRNIESNTKPDCIYRKNNHIAIDCGSGYGGRLGAICLDTGDEIYV